MAITNYGKSVHDRLLNISRERNLSYQTIVSRYIQERMLYRLSVSRFRNHFFLKGGALIYAFGGPDARPTVDVDFLGENIGRDINTISNVFKEVCGIIYPLDGITFDAESIVAEELMLNKEYNGVRIQAKATLHSMRERISMDIGFGDVIYKGAQSLEYPVLLDDEPFSLLAYSPESVVAEKFEAMIKLGLLNSRMKDFYDVYSILNTGNLNDEDLRNAILNTFENRKTKFDNNHPLLTEEFRKNSMRNSHWRAYLRKIKCKQDLDFAEVVSFILYRLKPLLPMPTKD